VKQNVLQAYGATDPFAFPHSKMPPVFKTKWRDVRIAMTISDNKVIYSPRLKTPFKEGVDPVTLGNFDKNIYI